MKKFVVSVVSVFLLILFAISVSGEMIGTNEKYASNQNIFKSKNLALKSGGSLVDGNVHTAQRFYKASNMEKTIDLGKTSEFNSIVIKEKGLNVKGFTISISDDGENFTPLYSNDKIEYYRLCSFKSVSARYIKLTITKCDNIPKIREVEIYNEVPEKKSDFRVATYSTLGERIYQVIDNNELSSDEKDKRIKEMIDAGYYDTITDYIQIGNIIWKEDGTISISGWSEKEYDEEKYYGVMMKNLHDVLDEKNVNLVLTILNPIGENGNAKVMKSITDNREALISNMISFVNKYKFNGIDLDWEFPMSQAEFDAYNSFLQELKARMKTDMWNKDKSTLSIALATWALKYTPETIKCIDYVNVMGYDILDQDGEHSSFFSSCVQATDYIEKQGFSKEQINLGFPFYGTHIKGNMEQYIYNAIDYEKITPHNNFYTMKKYDTGEDRYTYFNSQSIIRDKTAYAYLKGYGGVMIFSQYCDLPSNDEKSLTKAINDYLKETK